MQKPGLSESWQYCEHENRLRQHYPGLVDGQTPLDARKATGEGGLKQDEKPRAFFGRPRRFGATKGEGGHANFAGSEATGSMANTASQTGQGLTHRFPWKRSIKAG